NRNTKVIVPEPIEGINEDFTVDFSKFKMKSTQVNPVGSMPSQERYDFDYSEYSRHLPFGMTPGQTEDFGGMEYAMGEFQSGWNQGIVKAIPRVATKVAAEVLKLPGYLGGLGMWGAEGFDMEEIGLAVNNEWIRTISEAE